VFVNVVRPTAIVITVVLFRSLGGSSSTSRVVVIIGCGGASRVVVIIGCAGTSRGVIAGIVVITGNVAGAGRGVVGCVVVGIVVAGFVVCAGVCRVVA